MKLSKVECKNTTKVTLSNCISKFGDILFDYINSVWLTGLGNGGFWLAIYQSSETFISVFFNFLGGFLSDFKNRKKIIWICDLFCGLLCLFLGLVIPNNLFLFAIVLINAIFSIASSFRDPAYKAIFREIVRKDNIGRANSILETFKQIIKISGPSLALVIAKFVGSRVSLILDGFSFIISGLLVKHLNIITNKDRKKKKNTTLRGIFEGFAYLGKNKMILMIILFSSIINFFLAGYSLVLPFSNYSFSSGTTKVYAVFLTAESVGGLLGAFFSNFKKDNPTMMQLLIIMTLCGASLLPIESIFVISHSIILASIGIVFMNCFLSIFNIQFMTFVQTQTDIEYIGRVFSIIFSVAVLFMPFGTFFFQSVLSLKSSANYFLFGILIVLASLTFIVIQYFLKGIEK